MAGADDTGPEQGGGGERGERRPWFTDLRRGGPADIDIVPPAGPLPVSRAATERKLQRTDRYDRRAVVTGFERLTPTGTVLLYFQIDDGAPFWFPPGHFIGIKADVGAAGVRRSPYCISSPPNDQGTFRLLVRLVPEGPLSIYLGALQPGDVITFRGPSGRSMIPEEPDTELVFFVTGVGIGPVLALAQHLLPSGFDRRMRVFWGLRLVDDICLLDELDELAATYPNFSYQISLSRPPDDWAGLRGRVTESTPALLETLGGKHYYLVGNGAMIEELATVLSDLGVDQTMIHEEVYFNVRHRADPAVLAQIRARFGASDLFSPYAHQQAGGYMVSRPLNSRRRR